MGEPVAAEAAVSARLLELAADDDAAGLGELLAACPSLADEPAPWYSPARGAEPLTPLMVAAAYGSVACLDVLLSPPYLVDPNRASATSLSTALHFAAAGGASSAPAAVSRLLAAGADPTLLDHLQRRPSDLVALPPNSLPLKNHLLSLLGARKEWPPDPSLPDIKNGAYASDDFRMYSFKVRACSRAYSHDWTECPFVHPGENARRRDPRKYHYSCVPCPEFKKGAGCRRGDMCEYAHGVFESWLHPAQYRTRLCKDGVGCARRVCFFAHTPEELRPLYVSTGSAVPSPRGAMEMAAAAAAAAAAMGMGMSSPGSSFTPPLSPSAGGGGGGGMGGGGGAWPQQPSVPALCLPGSAGNLHLSRLRTSLSARDMAVDELLAAAAAADYDGLIGSPASLLSARGKNLVPSNLDDLFSAELAAASRSPRYADQGGAAFSPTRKAAVLNQFQQQQQSLLSPRAAAVAPEPVSPMSSRLLAALAQREKMQQHTLRSMSSRDLAAGASLLVGSPVSSSMSKWGFPSGNPDWGADDEELGRLKRCSSFELRSGANGSHEPDLSWVNTLVKEPTPEKPSVHRTTITTAAMDSIGILGQTTSREHIVGEEDTAGVISSWLEQLQLDEMVV
ncbi:zinc finger CCCH domain-containing protein 67 [Oryza brachyantha]|uniref:zinc finger CCCH domain-containing protein 67 n=1 Tax=Oryza brachyantha TaxID=4533 RepID=UPI001AD98DF8|nr:zinc finger CCCH domain-containing protein 67 [Oryza brachyantha]